VFIILLIMLIMVNFYNGSNSRAQYASDKLTVVTPLFIYKAHYTCILPSVSCPLVRTSIHCVPLHHPIPISHFIFINVVFSNSPLRTPYFAFQAKTLCSILYDDRASSQNHAINYSYHNMLRSRLQEHIYKQLSYRRRETKGKARNSRENQERRMRRRDISYRVTIM
jgi:hypothetical protein